MRAKLLNGDTILKLLTSFRVVSLRGRFGGGKTLLAVYLAYWLKGMGYVDHIVANMPVKFSRPVNEMTDLRRTAIILDEAWQYITKRADVINYSAYLRKLDIYLLLPSVFSVHSRLDFLRVQRLYNLQPFGLPLWIYQWQLIDGKARDNGWFALWWPQSMYGSYDTIYIPDDDGGVSKLLKSTVSKLTGGKNGRLYSGDVGDSSNNDLGDSTDINDDIADWDMVISDMRDAAEDVRDAIKRYRKR